MSSASMYPIPFPPPRANHALYARLPHRHAPATSRRPCSQDTTTALTTARSIAIHAASTLQPLASHSFAPPHLPRTPSHVSSGLPQEGTRKSPITLLDNDDKPPPPKRRLGPGHGVPDNDMPKKRRRVVQLQPFHADLEAGIIVLKDAIARESFEVKGKFPPALKPKLQQLALQAILLDEYNNFFAQMPQLFPYSRFTMTVRAVWATCFSGTHVGRGRNSSSGLCTRSTTSC